MLVSHSQRVLVRGGWRLCLCQGDLSEETLHVVGYFRHCEIFSAGYAHVTGLCCILSLLRSRNGRRIQVRDVSMATLD